MDVRVSWEGVGGACRYNLFCKFGHYLPTILYFTALLLLFIIITIIIVTNYQLIIIIMDIIMDVVIATTLTCSVAAVAAAAASSSSSPMHSCQAVLRCAVLCAVMRCDATDSNNKQTDGNSNPIQSDGMG